MKLLRRLRCGPLLTGALALLVAVVFAQPANSAGAPAVVVGVVMPLTGSLAAFGKTSLAGVELAAREINARGGVAGLGGAPVKLVVRDSTSEPAAAANATARLIEQAHPVAIIGAYASALSLTASSVCERAGVPFVTMSFTDDLTSRGYHYTFQVVPKASVIGAAQVSYAAAIANRAGTPLKRIAIIYENTAYGTSQAQGLRRQAERLSLEVALFEAYPHGLTDAMGLVQKVLASRPEVLFPVSYFTDAVLIVRALAQSRAKPQIVAGAAGFVIPAFLEALGPLTEGIMSVDTSNYDHYGKFEAAYQAAYHSFAPHEAYENAISLYVIAAALNAARRPTPAALHAALSAIDVHGGPFAGLPGGRVKFNASGLNESAYPIMVQWRAGNLATVWPREAARAALAWRGQPLR